MSKSTLLLVAFLVVPTACAQEQDHSHHHRTESSSYAADTARTIKALSPDELTGLREGRGMGLARAAELNHYPGPKHVLELADSLALSDAQRAEAERLMREVQTEARASGERIIRGERHLDQLFEEGSATTDMVDRITSHIAEFEGELRAVHLRAHVAMRDALTADQIATYDRLRGYTD